VSEVPTNPSTLLKLILHTFQALPDLNVGHLKKQIHNKNMQIKEVYMKYRVTHCENSFSQKFNA